MKINKYLIVIVIFIIGLLLLFRYAYNTFYKNSYLLIDQPYYGKEEENIKKNIKTSICNGGITWTYNFWIYVNDWKYRFGEKKYIIQSENVNVWLGEKTPNLHIGTNLFNSKKNKVITFENIPLQKWLNISIILDNRNLDLFINKELYRSIFFDEVPEQKSVTNLVVFPNGGLSGYISQLRYFTYNISRSRNNMEYSFGFRGIYYKYFIIRMFYKVYLFFSKLIRGDNIIAVKNISCT